MDADERTRITGRDFFAGGGDMGALMRTFDWKATSLGSPECWPQSLRTAVRIMLTTQHPMFIWWGPELIQFYNDAYRKTMGPERHPSALGQRGRDCWEEIWDIIGPQIEFVMNGKGATWNEDQLVPVTRHGKREDVWWTYSYGPIDDATAENGVGGVLVVCNDVTDRHRAVEALKRNEERLQLALSAGVVGTWDWHVASDKVFADERFAKLYGVDPKDAETGVPIERFVQSIHSDDRERVGQRIDVAVRSGQNFSEDYRLVQGDGTVRWVSARGRCFHDADGQPERFTGATIDITERKEAEQHRKLLADELSHRVKNMLSTVQAIANQTLKEGMSIADAREALTARLMALSRAQDVLTGQDWAGAGLRTVVTSAIEPHAGGANRFRLEGPQIEISPRLALSLALSIHELTTNAAKYGALSIPDGRVDVTWRINPSQEGEFFELEWVESGGPPVSRPERKGFGSRLIEGVMSAELGGLATVRYEKTGVIWTITAPLGCMIAHGPDRPAQ